MKPALCGPFRDYRICSAPPVLVRRRRDEPDHVALRRRSRTSSDATTEATKLRDFVLAQQLGYADRDHYVADPDAVTVPVADLLDPEIHHARARPAASSPAMRRSRAIPGAVLHGKPIVDMWGRDTNAAQPGTTHMSFVDFEGNAVSFTATVEGPFGSARWTNGFVLNNQLTDFTRPPTLGGKPVANAPGPGKRPRSSMSPTIVFDKAGDVFMVTGSPGGNSIVGYVSKTLVAVLDWGATAQEASRPAEHRRARPDGACRNVGDGGPQRHRQGSGRRSLTDAGFKVQEVSGESLRPQPDRRAQRPSRRRRRSASRRRCDRGGA